MSEIQKQTLTFENGHQATAVFPKAGTQAQEILNALAVSQPKAVILSIGGAGTLDSSLLPRLTQLYSRGVARAAIEAEALILDGGTQAGVMALMGEAVAARGDQTILIGVAPAGKIHLPGSEQTEGTLLEPNHSHFVLVEGNDWGAETPVLFDLVQCLTNERKTVLAAREADQQAEKAGAGKIPVVAVLSGGGAVSRKEVLRTIRQNIPLLVVEGSGGFADEIAATWKQKEEPIADPDMAEIIADGELHFHHLNDSVKGIERLIIRELGIDKVLLQAWETFASYDLNANLQQKHFHQLQMAIILLGIVGTALVVIQQVFAPRTATGELQKVSFTPGMIPWWFVYYLLILLPILLTVFITATNRFKQGNKWLLLRAGAESIKREIYSYRVCDNAGRHDAEQQLAKKVEDITRRTMQTEVNLSALKPYNKAKGFPPYMYASKGGDDGFSPLSPERYVEVRLGDQLNYYARKTLVLEKQLKWLYWCTFVIGGTGAFLAAVGQQVWIALTTSLVAALGTYLGYRQTENTLIKYNQTATDLANIRAWWNALTAEEQASKTNIASLVKHTEQVLQTELNGWIQQMQNALAELRKGQASGEGEQKENEDGQLQDKQQKSPASDKPASPEREPSVKVILSKKEETHRTESKATTEETDLSLQPDS